MIHSGWLFSVAPFRLLNDKNRPLSTLIPVSAMAFPNESINFTLIFATGFKKYVVKPLQPRHLKRLWFKFDVVRRATWLVLFFTWTFSSYETATTLVGSLDTLTAIPSSGSKHIEDRDENVADKVKTNDASQFSTLSPNCSWRIPSSVVLHPPRSRYRAVYHHEYDSWLSSLLTSIDEVKEAMSSQRAYWLRV